MIYNELMVSHFRGHPIVLEFADAYRGRIVRVFDVARDGVLGVSDGIDAWMISRAGVINGKQCSTLTPITTRKTRHALVIDQEEEHQAHTVARRNSTPRVALLV